ncbi:hypothetical protein VHEMI08110 [[Torrubiella] hemipterigena]|uniref:Uncharacterized protein n=1 Tax=[Torrubiella] hemipterigena TaxID=1531966 RepID=A0A0A1TP40_9HYPO|nr:hypothetical protein VHEMI08110 [[Torrubiella] hemipterigena]
MVCRFTAIAVLFATVATASTVAPVPGSFSTAIYNNCTDDEIHIWMREIPGRDEDDDDEKRVRRLPKGLSLMKKAVELEWIPMFYASTSEKGYMDHNTKMYFAGFNARPDHGLVHINGVNVFGKPNWMSVVAAGAEVQCGDNEPPQKWSYASDKNLEAKGMLECRNSGLTKYAAGVGFGFCVREEDFAFDKNLDLLVAGKPVGFSILPKTL